MENVYILQRLSFRSLDRGGWRVMVFCGRVVLLVAAGKDPQEALTVLAGPCAIADTFPGDTNHGHLRAGGGLFPRAVSARNSTITGFSCRVRCPRRIRSLLQMRPSKDIDGEKTRRVQTSLPDASIIESPTDCIPDRSRTIAIRLDPAPARTTDVAPAARAADMAATAPGIRGFGRAGAACLP